MDQKVKNKGQQNDDPLHDFTEMKKKADLKFLRDNYISYSSIIDNKQRLIESKFMRDRHVVASCCRFCVTSLLLILLMIWLPMVHNTQVEYHLTQSFSSKLEPGFDEIFDANSLQEYHVRTMNKLFYPSEKHSTYENEENTPYAKVKRMNLDQEAVPELFLVGQQCIIMHRVKLAECNSRVKLDEDQALCPPYFMELG